MIKMNNFLKKSVRLQEKAKKYMFEDKINKKEKLFKRKYDRQMDDEEIKSYTFYLFTTYSLIIMIPLIFLISLF